MISDLLLLVPAVLGLALVLLWRRKGARRLDAAPSGKAIVVDGSNVMYWGGEPSAKTITQVITSLKDRGFAPVVFFDANVGYKLVNRFMDAEDLAPVLGINASQIHVVDKGVIADHAILSFSADNGLMVVSNDRYRDWRGRFPHAGKKGRMLRGTYENGTVIWREKRRRR